MGVADEEGRDSYLTDVPNAPPGYVPSVDPPALQPSGRTPDYLPNSGTPDTPDKTDKFKSPPQPTLSKTNPYTGTTSRRARPLPIDTTNITDVPAALTTGSPPPIKFPDPPKGPSPTPAAANMHQDRGGWWHEDGSDPENHMSATDYLFV